MLVAVENRVGEEGDGFKIAMHTLDRSRPTIGAQAVGLAQGAIDAAAAYMHERKAFGTEIASFQGLRFMIADMAMKTEAARVLVYRACALIDAGDPDGELSMIGAMAKCFDRILRGCLVMTDAVQLFGGDGDTTDFPAERFIETRKPRRSTRGPIRSREWSIPKSLLG